MMALFAGDRTVVQPCSSATSWTKKEPMSHEASDEPNSCAEPDSVLSAVQVQEVAILKYWYAMVDQRPDPGVYRNADADGAARDVVELNLMISFLDPRAFTSPWVPYIHEEDLFEEQ
jgi:hypothetical protein